MFRFFFKTSGDGSCGEGEFWIPPSEEDGCEFCNAPSKEGEYEFWKALSKEGDFEFGKSSSEGDCEFGKSGGVNCWDDSSKDSGDKF